MKIFLIGYRCTGKTTIGKILANIMNFSFIDIDKKVESDSGITITDIVKNSGWDLFRKFEKNILFNTLGKTNLVVSTGGGIILDMDNRNFIKNNGLVIWLHANKNIIIKRLLSDKFSIVSRPSITNKSIDQETEVLIKQREPLYSEISNIKIDTSVNSAEKTAGLLKRKILDDR